MKETSPKSNNGTILDINESFKIEFDPISDALAAIRNGECIIVVDDERRENEGDLICAAQFATPQQINFMATEGRGLICLAMQGEKLDSLDLPLIQHFIILSQSLPIQRNECCNSGCYWLRRYSSGKSFKEE